MVSLTIDTIGLTSDSCLKRRGRFHKRIPNVHGAVCTRANHRAGGEYKRGGGHHIRKVN